jgi:hypothetical protein
LVALVAVVAEVAEVAVEAFPVKAPTNVVDVTLDNPAIVVAADPSDIEVDPTVTALFAKLALVIPAVPDKLEFVNPVICAEPENIPDPANICARVTDPPKEVDVPAIVIAELAKFALVIPAVPDKLEFVSPDIDPPKVTVPVPVIGPPVKVMPDTVPAVATEVTVPPPAVDVIVIAPDPEVIEIPDPAVKPASVIPDPVLPINTFPLSLLPPVNIAPAVTENGAAFNDNEAVAAVPDIDPSNEPVIEVATIFVAPN